MNHTWFQDLTGFREESPDQARANLTVEGETITSRINGRKLQFGRLETPTLEKLRELASAITPNAGALSIEEVVDDAQALHMRPQAQGALFQVASQFNLLEMASPSVAPEVGVSIYAHDHTQGPACAIASGAGTIYRNYFAPVGGQIGQSASRQIDCLATLGQALGNNNGRHWSMENGYALASEDGLKYVRKMIADSNDAELDELRGSLRIGLQWDTEVTLDNCGHLSRTGNSLVFLTLVGGGAFGNRLDWILSAIRRALQLFEDHPLDVKIVSYERPNPQLSELL